MTDLNVSFEQDIPKIERQGAKRASKYQDLLDQVKERAQKIKGKNKVAVLSFDTQSEATSRYMSIRDAVKDREDWADWKVASRKTEDDEGNEVINVYMEWNPEKYREANEEKAAKRKAEGPRKRTRKTTAKAEVKNQKTTSEEDEEELDF